MYFRRQRKVLRSLNLSPYIRMQRIRHPSGRFGVESELAQLPTSGVGCPLDRSVLELQAARICLHRVRGLLVWAEKCGGFGSPFLKQHVGRTRMATGG